MKVISLKYNVLSLFSNILVLNWSIELWYKNFHDTKSSKNCFRQPIQSMQYPENRCVEELFNLLRAISYFNKTRHKNANYLPYILHPFIKVIALDCWLKRTSKGIRHFKMMHEWFIIISRYNSLRESNLIYSMIIRKTYRGSILDDWIS